MLTMSPRARRRLTSDTAISVACREQVDEVVDSAMAAGAQPSGFSMDDGFMYGRSVQDLDGHLWEVLYMDMSAMPQ